MCPTKVSIFFSIRLAMLLPSLVQSQTATFAKARCSRLKITVEYHELAVRSSSEINVRKESSSEFRRENDRLNLEISVSGSFEKSGQSFSGEANAQYSQVSERESAKSRGKETEYEKKIFFMNHELQLTKKVATLFTINGHSAKVVTKLHVATVPGNKTKNYAELRTMANLETVRLYGHHDGKIQYNSYVREQCFKRRYIKE